MSGCVPAKVDNKSEAARRDIREHFGQQAAGMPLPRQHRSPVLLRLAFVPHAAVAPLPCRRGCPRSATSLADGSEPRLGSTGGRSGDAPPSRLGLGWSYRRDGIRTGPCRLRCSIILRLVGSVPQKLQARREAGERASRRRVAR